jgi:hypothetical protein
MAKRKLSLKKAKVAELERLLVMGFQERTARNILRASGPALAGKTIQWLRRSWKTVEHNTIKPLKQDYGNYHKPKSSLVGLIRMNLLEVIEGSITWVNEPSVMEANLKEDNLTIPSVDAKESERILWAAREAIMHFPPKAKKC